MSEESAQQAAPRHSDRRTNFAAVGESDSEILDVETDRTDCRENEVTVLGLVHSHLELKRAPGKTAVYPHAVTSAEVLPLEVEDFEVDRCPTCDGIRRSEQRQDLIRNCGHARRSGPGCHGATLLH